MNREDEAKICQICFFGTSGRCQNEIVRNRYAKEAASADLLLSSYINRKMEKATGCKEATDFDPNGVLAQHGGYRKGLEAKNKRFIWSVKVER